MRIALAQTEIFSKQYEKNKETAVSICNLAQAMEVRLLLFPEMSFTGFNMDTHSSIAAGLDTVPWMQKLAATGQCYLGFGWVKAAESGKAENFYRTLMWSDKISYRTLCCLWKYFRWLAD